MTYIHPADAQKLQRLAIDLPQSLLFTGPKGIGFRGIIDELSQILNATPIFILPEKDDKVDLVKGNISVTIIRRLYDMTRTRSNEKRIIIIDDADKMSSGAQNAFLKLLEEPSESTYFILLSHTPSALLSTIRSRVHSFEFHPITSDQSTELLNELGVNDATKRAQLMFIAGGMPAELTRLVSDDSHLESRSQIVRDARTLLQGNTYDALKVVDTYKDRREDSLILLTDASRLLKQNVTQSNEAAVIARIATLLKTYERILANGNVRLCLASAVLQ